MRLLSCLCLAAMLGVPAGAAAQVQTFDGILTIVWGDPDPASGAGGETRYTLVLADGTTARLQLAGLEPLAESYFSRPVSITGQQLPAAAPAGAALEDGGTILVTSIGPGPASTVTPDAVSGTRRVIYLLARFPDDGNVPHPPSFYAELNNPDTPPAGSLTPATLNGFFKKTSWNQFSWIGDVGGVGGLGAPGGWLTLPQPRSFYVPCGSGVSCARLSDLANDAMAAGRAQGINFLPYDNINFVFSNNLDCCAWGGGHFSQLEMKSFGATWEPPWGQNVPTYAHEMGHSIGLPHSGWVYYSYDSPWDVMSSVSSINARVCGSYPSTLSCGEPGDGYIAAHAEFLGWLPPSNVAVTDVGSSATVNLEALSLPLGAAIKMIKICLPGFPCSGGLARYLTVEARVKGLGSTSQFDNGIPGDGVLIHEFRRDRPRISGQCFFNNQSGWAVPVDATPGDYNSAACNSGGRPYPNYALGNAQLAPGQSLTLAAHGVSITVGSRTASSYAVSVVALGAPSISAHPASAVISPGQTATLGVTATGPGPLSYQWYAGTSGVTTTPIAGASSATFTTPPRFASTRYWVRVSDANGSANSTAASVRVSFSDEGLAARASLIRAVHIEELRSRIASLRSRFALAPYVWTDPSIAPGGTVVRALHISDLRTALHQAYVGAVAPPASYTGPVVAGGYVTTAHIEELRIAVHALEER